MYRVACVIVYFNSRPSARGDFARDLIISSSSSISIHAPPRGATLEVFAQDVEFLISIHAPPRGATTAALYCGERRKYFNSRPSARGDLPHRPESGGVRQFQFTPLREGRPFAPAVCLHQFISIHAPPRGATTLSSPPAFRKTNFNSRPSARGDALWPSYMDSCVTFQFTPLREGRPHACTYIIM